MNAVDLLHHYDSEKADEVSLMENDIDRYEDMIGTYLLKLSGRQLAERDSRTLMLFLECIGDFERISDHAVGIKEALKQMQEKNRTFSVCTSLMVRQASFSSHSVNGSSRHVEKRLNTVCTMAIPNACAG